MYTYIYNLNIIFVHLFYLSVEKAGGEDVARQQHINQLQQNSLNLCQLRQSKRVGQSCHPLHYSALFPLHSYIIVFVLSTLIALPALPAFSIFSLIPTSLLQFSYFKIRSVCVSVYVCVLCGSKPISLLSLIFRFSTTFSAR